VEDVAISNFVQNRTVKLLRLSLAKLSKEDNFAFVRSRIRVVRLFRHLLKDRYDQFQGLATFAPLLRSIEGLDRTMEDCELALRQFVVGELGAGELEAIIRADILGALNDAVSDLRPIGDGDDRASDDAWVLMDRFWDELISHVEPLHDALMSVWDDETFAIPGWRLKFERDEEEHVAGKTGGP
jgi:hypothetical protein